MIKLRLYPSLVGLLVAALLLFQTGQWANATHICDEPHEHEAIMCVEDALASETACVLPVPVQSGIITNHQSVPAFEIYLSVSFATPPGRAPPPRSPPFAL